MLIDEMMNELVVMQNDKVKSESISRSAHIQLYSLVMKVKC